MLDFGDDLDSDPYPNYDPDLIRISQICMKLLSKVRVWPGTNPLNCENDWITIGIRIQIINIDGGLQSLTGCLVLDVTFRPRPLGFSLLAS